MYKIGKFSFCTNAPCHRTAQSTHVLDSDNVKWIVSVSKNSNDLFGIHVYFVLFSNVLYAIQCAFRCYLYRLYLNILSVWIVYIWIIILTSIDEREKKVCNIISENRMVKWIDE